MDFSKKAHYLLQVIDPVETSWYSSLSTSEILTPCPCYPQSAISAECAVQQRHATGYAPHRPWCTGVDW